MNEAEGKPIAMAAMAFVDTEAGPVGLIRFLYVVPEFRGLGLELKLIDSLRRRCRDAGLGACFLRSALLSPGLSASLDGWGLKTCGTQYLID
jgi:GNAT superfamily N-acetyltransferase